MKSISMYIAAVVQGSTVARWSYNFTQEFQSAHLKQQAEVEAHLEKSTNLLTTLKQTLAVTVDPGTRLTLQTSLKEAENLVKEAKEKLSLHKGKTEKIMLAMIRVNLIDRMKKFVGEIHKMDFEQDDGECGLDFQSLQTETITVLGFLDLKQPFLNYFENEVKKLADHPEINFISLFFNDFLATVESTKLKMLNIQRGMEVQECLGKIKIQMAAMDDLVVSLQVTSNDRHSLETLEKKRTLVLRLMEDCQTNALKVSNESAKLRDFVDDHDKETIDDALLTLSEKIKAVELEVETWILIQFTNCERSIQLRDQTASLRDEWTKLNLLNSKMNTQSTPTSKRSASQSTSSEVEEDEGEENEMDEFKELTEEEEEVDEIEEEEEVDEIEEEEEVGEIEEEEEVDEIEEDEEMVEVEELTKEEEEVDEIEEEEKVDEIEEEEEMEEEEVEKMVGVEEQDKGVEAKLKLAECRVVLPKFLQCDSCSFCTRSKSQLETHMQVHLKPKTPDQLRQTQGRKETAQTSSSSATQGRMVTAKSRSAPAMQRPLSESDDTEDGPLPEKKPRKPADRRGRRKKTLFMDYTRRLKDRLLEYLTTHGKNAGKGDYYKKVSFALCRDVSSNKRQKLFDLAEELRKEGKLEGLN